MKKKLNILCFLLFLALFASLSFNIAGGVDGFNEALTTVNESSDISTDISMTDNEKIIAGLYPIRLNPNKPGVYTDSLYNEMSNSWIPIQNTEIITKIYHPVSKSRLFIVLVLAISYLLALGVSLVSFLKLIRNINKSIIFEWKNVRNLNILGIALLVAFLISFILGYMNYTMVSRQIIILNYNIDWSGIAQTMNLILGLTCLIVAEIFSLGLRLKEEQELTI